VERDLRNKKAGSRDENTLISGGAERNVINETSPRAPLISVFSSRDPAKRKVDNQQVRMAGALSENTLIFAGAN
jgi:hypothetical protein